MTEKDKATRTASWHQEGGDHYAKMQQDMQPWNVLSHWLTPEEYRGYQKGVAIAYLAREGSKGGDMDVRKAIHHLQRLVEEFPAQQPAFPPIIEPEVNADKAEDRHAELRKTWQEGQLWQWRIPGEDWNPDDATSREPAWKQDLEYRRHPDCTWKKPEAEDPHAELRKIYKPGMRWKCKRRFDVLWTDWEQLEEPGFRAGMEYEIHPDDLPKQDEDGYTIWHGGEQPEETKGKRVSVKLRTDDGAPSGDGRADNARWHHAGSSGDLIAYKVIE